MLFFNFLPICSKFIQKTFLLPPLIKIYVNCKIFFRSTWCTCFSINLAKHVCVIWKLGRNITDYKISVGNNGVLLFFFLNTLIHAVLHNFSQPQIKKLNNILKIN